MRKRLTLARVSPQVMALYRGGELQLDQVMAFTLTDDHAAQEAVLANDADPSVWAIRRALTSDAVRGSDPRAVFVGEDAYIEAGGHIRRDMSVSYTPLDVYTRQSCARAQGVATRIRPSTSIPDHQWLSLGRAHHTPARCSGP